MNQNQPQKINATTLKEWLHDGKEIALLDVREHGQYGEEHLFYVVNVPYSKLEVEASRLVPRKNVRMVLIGDATGDLSQKAFLRLNALGYEQIHTLEGGMPAWRQAGYEVFAGVNLPSKAFGELAEHAFNTPRITAAELNQKIINKENIIVLDGRPYPEYKKMSIPTAVCCPNGELPLRIDELAPNPDTTIVINCAGRTRSIIGAQTLINLGIPNKVLALENGTQGWYLADFKLNHGETKKYPEQIDQTNLHARKERANKLAKEHHVNFVNAQTVDNWLRDSNRTTFLCDVRTPEEYASGTVTGAQHTPGGQLVQATDQYVGIRGARLVLIDNEGVRAPAMASWLAMLGWEVAVWENALGEHAKTRPATAQAQQSAPTEISSKQSGLRMVQANQIAELINNGVKLIDLRPSMKYRESHIKSSIWSIRPLLEKLNAQINGKPVLILAEDPETAKLAAKDLEEMNIKEIYLNLDTPTEWAQAKLPLETTQDVPANSECIDYLFFVHDRHDGNKAAARQYLAWEMNLLAQIDEQERNGFKLPH